MRTDRPAAQTAQATARLGGDLHRPPVRWHDVVGDVDTPEHILGERVVARLRSRRDRPGALVALEDGRYAVTGPLLIAALATT